MRRLLPVLSFFAVFGAALPVIPAIAAEMDAQRREAAAQGVSDIEIPALFAPLIVEGTLRNYAYLSILVTPVTRDRVFIIREKMPFLRDAILRELNKSTIVKDGSPDKVDEEAIKTLIAARLNKILPAGTIKEVKIGQVIISAVINRT